MRLCRMDFLLKFDYHRLIAFNKHLIVAQETLGLDIQPYIYWIQSSS